jgi:hypothetical protein
MKKKQTIIPPAPIPGSGSRLAVSANAGVTALAPSLSHHEEAGQLFAEEVGRLAGVLWVERWSEEGPGVPTFHVYLRPDDRDTEYAVYELKGRVYDRFPAAYLDVVVLEAI